MSERELPPGWAWATIGELADFVTSGSRGWASYYSETGPLFIRIGNLNRGSLALDWTSEQRVSPPSGAEGTRTRVQDGDVLISITADVGLVGLVNELSDEAYINQHIALVRPASSFSSRFLGWSLLDPAGFQKSAREDQYGATKASLSLDQVRQAAVGVPPLNEQKRIVAKLEAVQARAEGAKAALDAVGGLLEKFRQSVLAAAFRGDLTREWRAQNPNTEPASALLARIRAERRRRWESANPKKKYVEPEPVDASNLPELPEGWCWAPLGWLGSEPDGTVQTGPFGAQLHSSEFTESGVPVIAVGNLTGMGFSTRNLYFISNQKAATLEKYAVDAGDLLFARSGATLGKVCVAPAEVSNWRMTGHILRARLNSVFMMPEIAVAALAGCRAVLAQVSDSTRGATRPGFNTGLLEGIILPIPPLAEQRTILQQVGEYLNALDRIALSRLALEAQVKHLNQATLAKAFRGELVPQDPTDEPASALLARIAATRSTETPKRRGRKAKV